MDPIQIVPQGTITVSVTGASAATALPTAGYDTVRQLEISNAGTVAVFVETGVSTVTAAVATGYPVLPNQCKVITIKSTATHVAIIGASAGPTTVYVSTGIGE
jgi:hypothetical protein